MGEWSAHQGPDDSGFSLIELVMVMTIVGLVGMMAMPRIDIAKYGIEGAMQGVGSTMLAAQRLALTRQHDIVITFDVPGSAITLHEDADNDGIQDPGERVRRQPLGENIVFGRGPAPAMNSVAGPVSFNRISNGLPALTFHRSGSSSEAGLFYITSKRSADHGTNADDARAIEIERATGRTNWYRYFGGAWSKRF